MLYGYLLSRSEFKIETPVESSSRDRRYSFQAYAELLLLMLEMSGYKLVCRDSSLQPWANIFHVQHQCAVPERGSAPQAATTRHDKARTIYRARLSDPCVWL